MPETRRSTKPKAKQVEDGGLAEKALQDNNIRRIAFDFQDLDVESVRSSLEPPVLFRPVYSSVVEAHTVIPRFADPEEEKERTGFRDYDPPSDPVRMEEERYWIWGPEKCARRVTTYLKRWAFHFSRHNYNWTWLLDSQLRKIYIPNPFFGIYVQGAKHGSEWTNEWLHEYEKPDGKGVYPHVVAIELHSRNGNNDSILLGELSTIIQAIYNRVNQVKVNEKGEEIWPRQYEFENEKRFPVLTISLFGPQHGRILYACLDGEALVIRQSPIYSFEKRDTAPWDFFMRMLLSFPVEE
ncbi:hypothetical protein AWENTII_000241 [Aspergillus wentii]